MSNQVNKQGMICSSYCVTLYSNLQLEGIGLPLLYVQLQKLAKSLKLPAAKLLSKWKEPICEVRFSIVHIKSVVEWTISLGVVCCGLTTGEETLQFCHV